MVQGLTDLRLVSPQCDHLSDNARALAVGSYEILENAKIYSSFEDSISDIQYVFATTGRYETAIKFTCLTLFAHVLGDVASLLSVDVFRESHSCVYFFFPYRSRVW